MDALRQYTFSVIGSAIICAVIIQLSSGAGKSSGIIKLLCGLFLAFTIISPVANIKIEELSDYSLGIQEDAQAAISRGEEFAQDSLAAIIKQRCEAYILDKASLLGAEIQAEVVLSEDSVPQEVYLQGAVAPAMKSKLQKIISEDIGIAKEYQIWIP